MKFTIGLLVGLAIAVIALICMRMADKRDHEKQLLENATDLKACYAIVAAKAIKANTPEAEHDFAIYMLDGGVLPPGLDSPNAAEAKKEFLSVEPGRRALSAQAPTLYKGADEVAAKWLK